MLDFWCRYRWCWCWCWIFGADIVGVGVGARYLVQILLVLVLVLIFEEEYYLCSICQKSHCISLMSFRISSHAIHISSSVSVFVSPVTLFLRNVVGEVFVRSHFVFH